MELMVMKTMIHSPIPALCMCIAYLKINGYNRLGVKASNTDKSSEFGSAISLSFDGNTSAVGARAEDSRTIGINSIPDSGLVTTLGAVYLYHLIQNPGPKSL